MLRLTPIGRTLVVAPVGGEQDGNRVSVAFANTVFCGRPAAVISSICYKRYKRYNCDKCDKCDKL